MLCDVMRCDAVLCDAMLSHACPSAPTSASVSTMPNENRSADRSYLPTASARTVSSDANKAPRLLRRFAQRATHRPRITSGAMCEKVPTEVVCLSRASRVLARPKSAIFSWSASSSSRFSAFGRIA